MGEAESGYLQFDFLISFPNLWWGCTDRAQMALCCSVRSHSQGVFPVQPTTCRAADHLKSHSKAPLRATREGSHSGLPGALAKSAWIFLNFPRTQTGNLVPLTVCSSSQFLPKWRA